MKKLFILALFSVLGSNRSVAQTDSFMYFSFDHTLFTGNTTVSGGVVPHFTDPGIEAITNKYSFKEFGELCSSCGASYWRDVYKVVVNNTYAGDELVASYPAIFSHVEKYHIELLGVQGTQTAASTILYPNPAKGALFIDHAAAVHISSISATDMTGRALRISRSSADRIELTHLTPGFYLVRLSFDDRGPMTERILINN